MLKLNSFDFLSVTVDWFIESMFCSLILIRFFFPRRESGACISCRMSSCTRVRIKVSESRIKIQLYFGEG